MAERYLRQSPLAHLGLDGRAQATRGAAGVALAERPFPAIVNLRGARADQGFFDAFQAAAGYALPVEANTVAGSDKTTALWLGPDEWWIVGSGPEPETGPRIAETLREALAGQVSAVTDVSHSRTRIRIAGPRAREVLQKGCPLDLHPREFGAGRCTQSHVSKTTVVLHRVADATAADGPAFDIYVLRSFADYLWRWLEDAAREYGVAVVEG